MGKHRYFFPQSALDSWLVAERVDLAGDELTLREPRSVYRIVEAFRILQEVTAEGDPHELIGRVKTRAALAEIGAEILQGSMIVGDAAFDVVPGFIGIPSVEGTDGPEGLLLSQFAALGVE